MLHKLTLFLLAISIARPYKLLRRSTEQIPSELPIHVCVHDEMKNEIGFADPLSPNDIETHTRAMQTATPAPIRINVDYSNLAVSATVLQFLQNLMGIATGQLKRVLKVIPKTTNIMFPSTWAKCHNANIPASHRNPGVSKTDLVIYVTVTNEPTQSFLAQAGACMLDSAPGVVSRPLVGAVNFNMAFLTTIPTAGKDIEYWAEVTIHEITHALGFSNGLYTYFQDPVTKAKRSTVTTTATIRGASRKLIITPEVANQAKQHFNCPSLSGLELENQGSSGSAGSHWERVLVKNELMTASGKII